MRASRYLLLHAVEDAIYALSCDRHDAPDSDLHSLFSALTEFARYVQQTFAIPMLPPKQRGDTHFYAQLDVLTLRAFPVLLGLEQVALSPTVKQVEVENLLALVTKLSLAAYKTCGTQPPAPAQQHTALQDFAAAAGSASAGLQAAVAVVDDWATDNEKSLGGVLSGAGVSREAYDNARQGKVSQEAKAAVDSVLRYLTSESVSWQTASDMELRAATAVDQIAQDIASGEAFDVDKIKPISVRATRTASSVTDAARVWVSRIQSGAVPPPNRSQALATLEASGAFDKDTEEVLSVISEATANEDTSHDPIYVPFFLIASAPLWATEGGSVERVAQVLAEIRAEHPPTHLRVVNPDDTAAPTPPAKKAPAMLKPDQPDTGLGDAAKGVLFFGGGVLLGATGAAMLWGSRRGA